MLNEIIKGQIQFEQTKIQIYQEIIKDALRKIVESTETIKRAERELK